MQEGINVQLFGYQIGFYIQEENKPNKNRDYEFSSMVNTILKCPDEDMELWAGEVKLFIGTAIARLNLVKEDYIKAKGLHFKLLSIDDFINVLYTNEYKHLQMHIPHLVLYYLKYDSVKVMELLTLLDDMFIMLPKSNSGVVLSLNGGHIINADRDILNLRDEVNNLNTTVKRITDNNYFFKVENLDVSEIVNIYLRPIEDIKYTVWVGGTEVVDHYTTYDEAKKVADEYIEKGYGDDVKIDTKGKDKK